MIEMRPGPYAAKLYGWLIFVILIYHFIIVDNPKWIQRQWLILLELIYQWGRVNTNMESMNIISIVLLYCHNYFVEWTFLYGMMNVIIIIIVNSVDLCIDIWWQLWCDNNNIDTVNFLLSAVTSTVLLTGQSIVHQHNKRSLWTWKWQNLWFDHRLDWSGLILGYSTIAIILIFVRPSWFGWMVVILTSPS